VVTAHGDAIRNAFIGPIQTRQSRGFHPHRSADHRDDRGHSQRHRPAQLLQSVQRTRQSEAAAALAQLQNTLVAYVDENNTTASGCGAGTAPTWGDLNGIAAVMTDSGPASDCTSLNTAITMPNGRYTITRTDNGSDDDYYEFTAADSSAANFNVMACVDLSNGASDLEQGSSSAAITASDLDCR